MNSSTDFDHLDLAKSEPIEFRIDNLRRFQQQCDFGEVVNCQGFVILYLDISS